MWYVYLLQSEKFPGQRYVGMTADLKKRLPGPQCWKISAYVQIYSMEIGDVRRVLQRTASENI
jgi:predicted GIY-YIG superfamily endonuclease